VSFCSCAQKPVRALLGELKAWVDERQSLAVPRQYSALITADMVPWQIGLDAQRRAVFSLHW